MNSNLRVIFAAIIVVVSSVSARAQSFDDIDNMLEAQFNDTDKALEKRFQQIEKAVDRAYRGVTRKIEKTWLDDVLLPNKSKWVTYSKDMSSRTIIDFEQGELVVEAIVDATKSASQMIAQIQEQILYASEMGRTQMAQIDPLSIAINEELDKVGLEPEVGVSKSALVDEPAVLQELVEVDSVLVDEKLSEVLADAKTTAAIPESAIPDSAIPDSALQESSSSEPVIKVVETEKLKKVQVRLAFVNDFQKILLEQHLEEIQTFSEKYKIPMSIVLAIIETESSFNPRATSPVPAFGLMQLVPKTAGVDAYEMVHGEKKLVSPEYLYQEANNLELGTAYFHLVTNRYLRDVKNDESRFYCAVASYNTGIGNVAKTFGQNKVSEAAKVINQMTPDEVLSFLLANLPATETKNYLKKILKRRAKYEIYDQA